MLFPTTTENTRKENFLCTGGTTGTKKKHRQGGWFYIWGELYFVVFFLYRYNICWLLALATIVGLLCGSFFFFYALYRYVIFVVFFYSCFFFFFWCMQRAFMLFPG